MNRVDKIYNRVINLKILNGMKFSLDYKYSDIMTPVVDAVFTQDEDNHRFTLETINRFKKYFKVNKDFSVNDFLKQVEEMGAKGFAKDVLNSQLKTSSKNGILRAEAIILWAKVLNKFRVNTIKDIIHVYDNPNIEIKIKEIAGQENGETLKNFLRIAGHDLMIKPKRYMIDFVNDSIDEIVDGEQTLNFLKSVTKKLKKDYPKLRLSDLDYAIWYYMQTPPASRMPNEIRNMNRPPKDGSTSFNQRYRIRS